MEVKEIIPQEDNFIEIKENFPENIFSSPVIIVKSKKSNLKSPNDRNPMKIMSGMII